MTKRRALTQEDFDKLLTWLDADRELAGKKYEDIRQTLIKIFIWRGCLEAEDLADETINRVAPKVLEVSVTYTGDPALYFYGVGKKLLQEYRRRVKAQVPLDQLKSGSNLTVPNALKNLESEHRCLDKCIQQLSPENRELILRYYREEKQAKIDARKDMAKQAGIAAGNLRVRIYRLRLSLEKCVRHCLKNDNEGEID